MTRFLRSISTGVLLLGLVSFSSAQEVQYSAGPTTGAQNLQGLGFSWGDYNQDGYLDLFVEPDNLIMNVNGTSFTRVASSGVAFNVAMVGSMFADINGDGYPDLFTTQGTAPPRLYQYNPGTHAFEDATATSGDLASMTVSGGQMYGLASADYNGDGYVDLVWGSGANATAAGLRMLKGSATGFVNVGTTSTAPVIDTTKAFEPWNPHFVDVNNDGNIDLFMPSFRQSLLTTGTGCVVYLNNGNGTFSPVATPGADTGLVIGGVPMKVSAIASAWGDFDNDGIMDLATSALGGEERGSGFRLSKGNGDGTFTDVTAATGIIYNSGCRALSWGDYNNDGFIDLMQSRGFNTPVLWRNNGDGSFTSIAQSVGIPASGFNTRSVGFIDYDSDGFLDFYSVPNGTAGVWHNGGNLNNWIAFKATASGNNGMGIGTRFTVYTYGGAMKQIRNIEGGGSGGATSGSNWAQFGLGIADAVDSVVVTWPDGSSQTFVGLGINRYWMVKQGAIIPDAPVLVDPADGATGQSGTPILTWNAANGALAYRVQVSLDPTFTDPSKLATDMIVSDTSQAVLLGLGGHYYWRVYAMNAGFSSVSAVSDFTTTATAPTEVPALVSPASNAIDQPSAQTLVVGKTSDASQYRWQVSTLRAFTGFTVNELTVDTVNSVQLTAGTKYYWRVRGENTAGVTGFSNPDSFTVMAAPATPALVSPANNAQNTRRDTLYLYWRSVALAGSYVCEVARSSATGLIVDTYTTTDTTLRLLALLNQTTYYWRVRAYNIGGSSLFSGANAFTTIIAPPGAPALVSPSSGAVDVPVRTTFVWNASVNATRYRLQVSTDNTFATIVRDTVIFEDTTMTLAADLLGETPYFWRVAPANIGGQGAYSTVRLFTTTTTVGVEESEGQLPKEFALLQNFPNPFNPSTTIRYDLPKEAFVKIIIFDILGREITTLVDELQGANRYKIEWNPSALSTGVYVYRMEARSQDGSATFVAVKKLLYMK